MFFYYVCLYSLLLCCAMCYISGIRSYVYRQVSSMSALCQETGSYKPLIASRSISWHGDIVTIVIEYGHWNGFNIFHKVASFLTFKK